MKLSIGRKNGDSSKPHEQEVPSNSQEIKEQEDVHEDQQKEERSVPQQPMDPSSPAPQSTTADTSIPKSSKESASDSPSNRPEPINKSWTHLTEGIIHRGIRSFNVCLATTAATYPKLCLSFITLFSFAIVATGFATNFELVFSHDETFTPLHSRPKQHSEWIQHESDFPRTNDFVFLIHANGESVMNVDAIRRLFLALDTYRNASGYQEICDQSHYLDVHDNKPNCWIWSATNFWNHNATEFETTVTNDNDVARALSQKHFQDGSPVFQEALFGKFRSVNKTFVYNAIANEIFWYPHEQDYLTYVPNYVVSIGMPDIDDSYYFQERLLEVFNGIRTEWQQQSKDENPNNVQLEFFCTYAYELEYARALYADMYLVPVIFFVMLGFTCFIFHRYGREQANAPSRATIGMASVVTIGMSMMSGFGLLFCCGVPFTNITLMAPFIILGVGLDDTFIITGAYFRRLREEIKHGKASKDCPSGQRSKKHLLEGEGDDDKGIKDSAFAAASNNPDKDHNHGGASPIEQLWDHTVMVDRIRSTMEEVGMSISLTTITTTTAFALGSISSIPGIRWLCLYACVTIVFDSFYQVTYFIALLTLDERRVVLSQAKAMVRNEQFPDQTSSTSSRRQQDFQWSCSSYVRRFCAAAKTCFRSSPADNEEDEDQRCKGEEVASSGGNESTVFIDRFMSWYARTLLKPRVRNSVIVFCLVLSGVCIYSTTQLTQKFDPQDYVPEDSYTQGFFNNLYEYAALALSFEVYFRGVDQSDPKVQRQMRDYVFALSAMPQINRPPDYCWIVDLEPFLAGNVSGIDTSIIPEADRKNANLLLQALENGSLTFEEKMTLILRVPALRDLYGEDIVFDDEGEIVASRCYMYLREFDLDDVQGQIDLLFGQRGITESQPINQLPTNQGEWAFFTFDFIYSYWELYAVAVQELVFTTISGVVAVVGIGFLMIPHWTATLFIGPLIVMLYFDLLGVMQFCGIHINAVTYVTIVISIGLLVDFLMHIMLRYYETSGSTREAKVKQTLETMGASMMLGGFTTWLGVIPMALSTTSVFMTIFIAFFAMVSLGLLIGLAFLPAILSICGPIITLDVHNLGEPVSTVDAMPTMKSPERSYDSSESTQGQSTTHKPYQLVESIDHNEHDDNPTSAVVTQSPNLIPEDCPSESKEDEHGERSPPPRIMSATSCDSEENRMPPIEHIPHPPGSGSEHSSKTTDGRVPSTHCTGGMIPHSPSWCSDDSFSSLVEDILNVDNVDEDEASASVLNEDKMKDKDLDDEGEDDNGDEDNADIKEEH